MGTVRYGGPVESGVLVRGRLASLVVVVAIVVSGCGSGIGTVVPGEGSSTPTVVGNVTVPGASSGETDGRTIPPNTTTATTPTTSEPVPLPLDASGVVGRVTAGPTCPVARSDQPCPPHPVVARVESVDPTGNVVGMTTTDDAGRYAIHLAPGDYTLHIGIDGPFPRCPESKVTVPPGPAVTVNIDCDTGIR